MLSHARERSHTYSYHMNSKQSYNTNLLFLPSLRSLSAFLSFSCLLTIDQGSLGNA